ncbi:unnamed protein product [Echinostoma caproni]|uniref:Secreted protein n=1 Tax=Echinostoma caproni TaxID=27848 RepID=A0A183BEV9_9TREM|nr:unnamed protein product [Echinostoma caproni]
MAVLRTNNALRAFTAAAAAADGMNLGITITPRSILLRIDGRDSGFEGEWCRRLKDLRCLKACGSLAR